VRREGWSAQLLPRRPEEHTTMADHPRLRLPWSASDRLIPRAVVQPLQRFLHTEASGGVVLIAASAVALVWANSPWSDTYEQLWTTGAELRIGPAVLHEDLRHWVNDLFMALFFFIVGIEIKREVVHGDLRDRRVALLPIACAVGGMVVPAALYLAVAGGTPGAWRGWGIPMATDIAFSLGVLALLGNRAPASLKVFLLALAIADDIGAIVVIALFYGHGVSFGWLVGAMGGLATIVVLRRLRVRFVLPYVVLAGAVWVMTFESGVHATIAGVAVGLLTPAKPFQRPTAVAEAAQAELDRPHLRDELVDEQDETSFLEVSTLTREAVSPLARMERVLHPWSAMVVLPLFALANAGIPLAELPSGDDLRVTAGVGAGLLVGKPVGVLLAGLLAVRLAGALLPPGATWRDMTGVGLLAGIGFTVSLFITSLAFEDGLAVGAKLGIMVASVLAGAVGAAVLALRPARPAQEA
jgi:NhaA family Na+:H+ antiporter